MFKLWEKINALENILGKTERKWYLLLLLLSRFSRVRLCATPETATHQAPPSLGFSRQEHWSGLPFPSPMHESKNWKWSHSVVSDSSNPMDCSLPGSSVHEILQARVLEWIAIAFSHWHWCIITGFSSCANREKTLTATTLYIRKLGIKSDWNHFRTVMHSK